MKLAVNLRPCAAAVILSLGGILSALAAPVGPGGPLPSLALADQHGHTITVDATTRIVLFAPDKAAGDVVRDALRTQPAGVLERLNAVYVADISAMPAMITRLFALPKLRELPYSVGLGYDAEPLSGLPHQAGMATVLRAQDGKVVSVSYAADAGALRKSIGLE